MKKIIKKYNVYKFDELNEEAQGKILKEETKQAFEEFCKWDLNECMHEEAKKIINDNFKNNKIELKNVYYSLNYCQGDGAMMELELSLEDVNKRLKIFTKKEMEIFEEYGSIFNIKHNNANYYHAYTFEIENYNLYYSIDYALSNEEITATKAAKLEKKLETMEKELKEVIINMNLELERSGYNMLEDESFFQEIAKENIKENDAYYLENGDLFYV